MPEVIFNGAEGRLEGRYSHSTLSNPPVALVLHPHPQHGGTMNNKVTYNIFHSFAKNNFSVMRFNFRGVGKSEGKFDDGIGELTDAATALDWLQAHNPNSTSFWVAGFSFGAWVALQLLMRRPEIQGFVAVSPPTNKYDFSFLSPCPAPGLIIQGNQDSIVSEQSVMTFSERLAKQRNSDITYNMIEGADHFFRDKLTEMNSCINEFLDEKLSTNKPTTSKPDRRRRQLVE